MKLFITPPNKHLELTELGDGFYCLAQLYKKDSEYKEYTLEQKKKGRFIICDNGAGDHGEVIQKEELFEIMKEIMPNEIIPTDILYNSNQTIENCLWFIDKMKEENIQGVNIFACPQGDTLTSYLNCFYQLSSLPEIKTIGLSKKTVPFVVFGPKTPKDQRIGEARNKFYNSYLPGKKSFNKAIHCLGMGDVREYWLYKNQKDERMRSTDSCYPILAAINGIDIEKTLNDPIRIPTPENYFDLIMTKDQIDLAVKNINFVKSYIE